MTSPLDELYREIPLTQGQVALISEEDFILICHRKWRAWWNKNTQSFYAISSIWVDGHSRTVYMHRELLGLRHGDKRQGDHIHPADTLDNRRSNLRIATHAQSQCNKRISKNNTTGHKGVYWIARRSEWWVQISLQGKTKFIGAYTKYEVACKAQEAAAARYYGEFARTA